MARDKLAIDDRNFDVRIGWWCADEGDFGLTLGDGPNLDVDGNYDDRRWIIGWNAAQNAVAKLGCTRKDSRGFYFEMVADAKAALRVALAAWESATSEVPWPDWALKAKAAGWKPPKNWKP